MKIPVDIVSAFIDGESGGNPAGVVLDANGLSADQKLGVAQAVGLSETAFVSDSSIATIKLEFFTPSRQIAHCGHATIATFSRMRELGRVGDGWMSKETIDGTRKILMTGPSAYMEQRAPRYTAFPDEPLLLDSLHLRGRGAAVSHRIVNTGNSFLLVEMADAQAVAAVSPNLPLIKEISEQHDLIGYYVFSTQASTPDRQASARMFAPRYGIDEESATGMAAGPLACYLHDHKQMARTSFLIEQGHLMRPASPSVIHVDLTTDKGAITCLMAGGQGRSTKQLVVEV